MNGENMSFDQQALLTAQRAARAEAARLANDVASMRRCLDLLHPGDDEARMLARAAGMLHSLLNDRGIKG